MKYITRFARLAMMAVLTIAIALSSVLCFASKDKAFASDPSEGWEFQNLLPILARLEGSATWTYPSVLHVPNDPQAAEAWMMDIEAFSYEVSWLHDAGIGSQKLAALDDLIGCVTTVTQTVHEDNMPAVTIKTSKIENCIWFFPNTYPNGVRLTILPAAPVSAPDVVETTAPQPFTESVESPAANVQEPLAAGVEEPVAFAGSRGAKPSALALLDPAEPVVNEQAGEAVKAAHIVREIVPIETEETAEEEQTDYKAPMGLVVSLLVLAGGFAVGAAYVFTNEHKKKAKED